MQNYFANRRFSSVFFSVIGIALVVASAIFLFWFIKNNKKELAIRSLSAISALSKFLPIGNDEKKELEVVNRLVQEFTKKDNRERTFLIFLQNNYELRPGGGFLGQYAVLKIKNGGVTSVYFEDANLLDQRIVTKVSPPYAFKRMLQLKTWKFRDSNFSPDFPANIEKARYFMRLAGKSGNYDGYIAVNSNVLNHVLDLVGPVDVSGITFTGQDGALKLEEVVEKKYIINPELDTQNRKAIMREMAPIITDKLMNLGNIAKIAELAHKELKDRNIMLNLSDPELQNLVASVYWDGAVGQNWNSDYLMLVDANMGSLKTDYYMRREINYEIDLTSERPRAAITILYKNTAPYGDWRTSDYHTYSRLYVPKGSTFIERQMMSTPVAGEELGKTTFGFVVHVLIGHETQARLVYDLPLDFNRDDYRLLIQKQSGMGDTPVRVKVKTKDGEFESDQILESDLKFEFQK